ncbi:hypothetical protein HED60_23170 [Planctomycetales bacterium ZRK34]|nr:hypothetical protein HED60_23170 [Planctomycetales bacterium ZRK34]
MLLHFDFGSNVAIARVDQSLLLQPDQESKFFRIDGRPGISMVRVSFTDLDHRYLGHVDFTRNDIQALADAIGCFLGRRHGDKIEPPAAHQVSPIGRGAA